MSGDSLVPELVPAAERERVVALLTRYFVDDALTDAELESRLQRVYGAATQRELDAVVSDLPALVDDAAQHPAGLEVAPSIVAVLSGHESAVAAAMPRAMALRARLGYVELDLTRARFQPGITSIDIRAFAGYVQVRLPTGVRVENAGRGLLGFFAMKGAPGDPQEAASVVRITGRAFLGFAECLVEEPESG